MLRMVIEKPIQFTMVSAVPLSFSGAFCATKVENNGESAMTTMPQKRRKRTSSVSFSTRKMKGATKQQQQESNSAKKAIFFVPYFLASKLPKTQAILPTAIIKKDIKGILNGTLRYKSC